MNVNSVTIVGRLTRDPELKALPSGQQVASLSIATSRVYNDKDGKRQEASEYHNIVVFGKTAENCGRFLVKGQMVMVQGRLQTRSWDKDGTKQYRTEVVADQVQFGPKAEGHTAVVRDTEQVSPKFPEYPEEEINPEDIPF
ncbi:MAG: single-stranded DNA-binding protein [Sphingopyxis sp.]|nr:single-stranded DNA-binding protein [Sphingopyxis sp.]